MWYRLIDKETKEAKVLCRTEASLKIALEVYGDSVEVVETNYCNLNTTPEQ